MPRRKPTSFPLVAFRKILPFTSDLRNQHLTHEEYFAPSSGQVFSITTDRLLVCSDNNTRVEAVTQEKTSTELEISRLCCLLVNFRDDDLAETWVQATSSLQWEIPLSFASPDEAIVAIETGGVCSLVLFASEMSEAFLGVLQAFRRNMGTLGAFQMVVCDEPSPYYMAALFEFSIEKIVSTADWAKEAAALTRLVQETLADQNSSEYRTMVLNQLIRTGDQLRIAEIQEKLREAAEYDHLAAFSFGKALEATGDFENAAAAYRQSGGMNKLFRASHNSLGETLMVTGKLEEAQAIFEKLERSNPRDSDRKLQLAAIYIEKGDFETAKKYMKEAAALAPGNPRMVEAKAHMYLRAGKVQEAFQLMDKMSEVGPFFAAKLNEMGIKLSQAGKGKSALALYKKAHSVVRPELRYKISINAALACHRLGEFEMAMEYVTRCEQEYGAPFEKAEKIRQAILKSRQKGVNPAA